MCVPALNGRFLG
ncbi:Protein of unknown function [Pyronema omphalodes CBS 100304]|uniref:Uncharacterized protein n=1 Tax=Pyronema omphalodes (strain CBS 100304) TaxID=1076935 RepID=U4KX79_PYROM|nr:Protein of unknown function [Pyronema omphalodes CBS 100304]